MVPMMAGNVASARLHLTAEIGTLQRRLWANAARLDELTGGRLANTGRRSPIRS